MGSLKARRQMLVVGAILLQSCGGTTVDVGGTDSGSPPGSGAGGKASGSAGSNGAGADKADSGPGSRGGSPVEQQPGGGGAQGQGGEGQTGEGQGGVGQGGASSGASGASVGVGAWGGQAGSTNGAAAAFPGGGGNLDGKGGNPSGKGGTNASGYNHPGGSVGTGGLPVWPDPTADAGPSTVAIVGTWNGYTENGISPWDTNIRLVITSANDSTGVQGTITVGTGDPPSPATNPKVGYPPSYVFDTPKANIPEGVYPGFPYTLLKGTVKDGRVRFTVALAELWRTWCMLQTSYPVTDNGSFYSCLPANGSSWSQDKGCSYTDVQTKQDVPVDCGQLQLCMMNSYCECKASGCTASQSSRTFTCDLRFDAAQATGSCTEGAVTGSTTRLFRAE